MEVTLLENTERWSAIEEAVKTRPIKDVAKEYAVSPGVITAALLRTSTTRDPVQAAGAPPPPPRARATPAGTTTVNGIECRAGTRDADIAAHKDSLGVEPDAVIAQKVGVSVRTVAAFRRRHGISGRKGRGPSKKAVDESLPPEKTVKTRKKTKKTKAGSRPGRKSKIDEFADLVGTRPDREIAEMADVSTNAVVAYRRRRGIPSARASKAAAEASAPATAPAKEATAAPKAARKPPPRRSRPGADKVFRVDLHTGGSAFVVAGSLVEAAQKAQSHKGVIGVSLAGDLLS